MYIKTDGEVRQARVNDELSGIDYADGTLNAKSDHSWKLQATR
jgi:hypothetical protein